MTDRERYLILLSAVVRGRYDLRRPELVTPPVARSVRDRHMQALALIKDETSTAQFQVDCAESEAAMEVYSG